MPYRNDATKIIANLKDDRAILVLIESLLDESIHLAAREGLLSLGESTIPALIYVVESDVSAVFQGALH